MTKFGYSASLAPSIGLVLLVCTIVMLIPRTAVLGCILVTGYLGGAVATQVRVNDAWFMFPVALGVLAWLGLYLRDARLRSLLPLARTGLPASAKLRRGLAVARLNAVRAKAERPVPTVDEAAGRA